jgi:superfamily II DNA/RNA helicase
MEFQVKNHFPLIKIFIKDFLHLYDDVDYIIRSIPRSQMIVFSATIPLWLKKSDARYMSSTNKSFINLFGDQQEKKTMNV